MKLTYLDVSTGHLCHNTMELLEAVGRAHTASNTLLDIMRWPAMTVAVYDKGVFLTVPQHCTNDQRLNMPQDLQGILAYATERGIPLIRLDSDGHVIADLHTYDW